MRLVHRWQHEFRRRNIVVNGVYWHRPILCQYGNETEHAARCEYGFGRLENSGYRLAESANPYRGVDYI